MPGAIKILQIIHLPSPLNRKGFISVVRTLSLVSASSPWLYLPPGALGINWEGVYHSTVDLGADHAFERLLAIPGYKPPYNCCVLSFSFYLVPFISVLCTFLFTSWVGGRDMQRFMLSFLSSVLVVLQIY